MDERYEARWQDGSGEERFGVLVVSGDALTLESRAEKLRLPFTAINGVEIGRLGGDRLGGRPTLLIHHRDGLARVAVPGAGILLELCDRLAATLAAGASGEAVAVVVPLKEGSFERAQQLIAAGPPFDPADYGLTAHQVFLTETEAVFVFSGRDARRSLEWALHNPATWKASLAWRGCVGGKPRVSQMQYLWSAQPDAAADAAADA